MRSHAKQAPRTAPDADPAARSRAAAAATTVAGMPLALLLTGHVALAADAPTGITTNADVVYSLGTLAPLPSITIPTYHATITSTESFIPIPLSNIGVAGAAEGLDVNKKWLAATQPADGALMSHLAVLGSVTNLAAGQTAADSMVLLVRTQSQGGIFHPSVVLQVESNGATTSGNGLTARPDASFTVNATVIPFAKPSLVPGTLFDLGGVRIGAPSLTHDIAITNAAPVVPQGDLLIARDVSVVGAGFSASGGFGVPAGGVGIPIGRLAPGETNPAGLTVSLKTTVAGTYAGEVSVNFLSDGQPTGNAVVPVNNGAVVIAGQDATTTVGVVGTVYQLASPTTITQGITIVDRAGPVAPVVQILASNAGTTLPTEMLQPLVIASPPGLPLQSGTGPILPGQTGVVATIPVMPNVSMNVSGSIYIDYNSIGVANEVGADTPVKVGEASIPVDIRLYGRATPVLPTELNFGIAHVGDAPVVKSLPIANIAPGQLTDVLRGSVTFVNGGFDAVNAVLPPQGIAAGTTSTAISFGMRTDIAAAYDLAQAKLQFASHNSEMADAQLPVETVRLSGAVNNYAKLALANPTVGHLDQSGQTLTWDVGTIAHGAGAIAIALDVLNAADGPADDLTLLNLTTLSNTFLAWSLVGTARLGARETASGGMRFLLPHDVSGEFSYSFLVAPFGQNLSGYFGALPSGPFTLTIQGTVGPVPEPWSISLFATGLAAVLGLRSRRPADRASRRA